MDDRKVYGQYIVGMGKDFKTKPNKAHYGFDATLDPSIWYVVHITGKILGSYVDEGLANILAKGLDKRDRGILTEEMEKVLSGEENHQD